LISLTLLPISQRSEIEIHSKSQNAVPEQSAWQTDTVFKRPAEAEGKPAPNNLLDILTLIYP
jgi:hypothetical protein